jgi:hypothetical protein
MFTEPADGRRLISSYRNPRGIDRLLNLISESPAIDHSVGTLPEQRQGQDNQAQINDH